MLLLLPCCHDAMLDATDFHAISPVIISVIRSTPHQPNTINAAAFIPRHATLDTTVTFAHA